MPRKLLKSKLFWLIIIILIVIAGIFIRVKSKKGLEYITEEVRTGKLIQTVSATGSVKSAEEIELNFKNTGKIAILKIKVGDKVKAGQILSQQKATDLAINILKYQAALEQAKANLDKVVAGATPEEIAVYEVAVESAKTTLANAEIELENTKATYSQSLEGQRQLSLTDINTALAKADISLQVVYDTLNYKGDENNLVVSNNQYLINAKTDYQLALLMVASAKDSYNLAKINPTDENIIKALADTLTALGAVSTNLDDMQNVLSVTVTTVNLTQTNLDSLKTDINTEKTTTNSSINTVQGSRNDLEDAKLTYQSKVDSAQQTVDSAKKSLAKANADLALKKAAARPEDIALYQAKVKDAEADLRLAQDKYNDTILKAPIDGTISEVNYKIGEQTSLTTPAIKMLAEGEYEVEVDIPESDIVKIKISDNTDITLDAFSEDQIFKGIITRLDPAQTEIQDVIYYKVTATFQKDHPADVTDLLERIKPGMTANVTVTTNQKNNVLIIPFRAVVRKDSKNFVRILENSNPKEVEVTLGLRGDEGLTEIVSGLSEGQKVITFVREK